MQRLRAARLAKASTLTHFNNATPAQSFRAWDNDTSRSHLWRSDGTEAGTVMIAPLDAHLVRGLEAGNTSMFVLLRSANGSGAPYEAQLWSTDATASGTSLVKTFTGGPWSMDSVAVVDGVAYFMLQDKVDQRYVRDRRQLWRSDGTAAGTVLVEDLSRFRRADIEQRIHDQIAKTGYWFVVWDDEDRDNVQVSNIDGRIVVKTPDDTLVYDPPTMTSPIGPAHGYPRLDKDGTLRVFGTLGADDIRVYRATNDPNKLVVKLNGVNQSFRIDSVARVRVYGYGGDDFICVRETYGAITKRLAVWGGDGNDRVIGGSGRDSIWGENGDDNINSGKGDDTLAGGSGDDTVIGSHGTDVVSGGGGDDCIDGGFGTDVIFGEQVFEIFYNGEQGQDQNDLIELVLN